MSLQPVDAYFTVEMWLNRDKSLGFRLTSNDDKPLDSVLVAQLTREVSQELNRMAEDSPVAVAFMIHENGQCYLDYQRERNFAERDNYVYTREQFNRVLKLLASKGTRRDLSPWLRWIWNLEWFVRGISGRLQGPQNKAPAAPLPSPPLAGESLDEPQNGSENGSKYSGSNVIAFGPRDKDR